MALSMTARPFDSSAAVRERLADPASPAVSAMSAAPAPDTLIHDMLGTRCHVQPSLQTLQLTLYTAKGPAERAST